MKTARSQRGITRTRRRVSWMCAAAALLGCSSLHAAPAAVYGDDVSFNRARHGYSSDACYYYGRCTADDLRALRDRLQRLDRVTPQPPSPESPMLNQRLADVPPTPVEHIRPEFRDASQVREEYREKPEERQDSNASPTK